MKDADGKPMVQVVDLGEDPDLYPKVLFNFENTPAVFAVDLENGLFLVPRLYEVVGTDYFSHWIAFSEAECTGNAAIWTLVDMEYPNPWGLERFTGATISIMGPDPNGGSYRVFRSNASERSSFFTTSEWHPQFGCQPRATPSSTSAFPAFEVLANPLADFHGPTIANPERVLTIEGGTRLP